jgi:orotate phosphoribosyltransferase
MNGDARKDLRIEIQDKWITKMTAMGCYWHHDGNKLRPFARLTAGGISNFFANCSIAAQYPKVLQEMANDMLLLCPAPPKVDVWVGSAFGAITLAHELGRQQGARAWFTTKVPDDKKAFGGQMVLDRFGFDPGSRVTVGMAEDVVTSFKTTRESISAVYKRAEADNAKVEIFPYVFCIVNRSGTREHAGFTVVPLIEVGNAKVWEDGKNPFLAGDERVPPVRPKSNWSDLTREYPKTH